MRPAFTTVFALLLSSAGAAAVTRAICAECHASIASTYSLTPMALSSGISGSIAPALKSSAVASAGFSYKAGHDQSGYFFSFEGREQGSASAERRELPYFIGSGAAAVSFLMSVDRFLYEAPVTWYSRIGTWGLSPGYERYSYPFLTRAVVPRCLSCHASGIQAIGGTQNGYASPPFLEGGVSCERCHGAGELHVNRMRANHSGQSSGILNPVKLGPERRDSICAQCHLTGEVLVEKAGREHRVFVPGENLNEYSIAFSRARSGPVTAVTSHVEDLAQSRCKQASASRLWCGTCHNAHALPAREQKAEWFRAKCLTCHAVKNCAAKLSARNAVQDNCVTCHMPKNSAADAQHVVSTDHSIPRSPVPKRPAAANTLVAFEQKAITSRDLGLAYAILAVREQNTVFSGRAFELLKDAVGKAPDDPQVLSYLADLYKKRSDDAKAVELYRRLLQGDPADSSAPAALGAYAMERGNYDEAIRFWRDALRKSPALLLVRANLAVALQRKGQTVEARTVLNKALEFNPNFKAARDLLGKLPP